MNEGITDADLQMLLSQNPLAAEQLRRIIAERLVLELKAERANSQNGTSSTHTATAASES